MYSLRLEWEGFDPIIDWLGRIPIIARNLIPLGMEIGEILQIDNMQARMLGVDWMNDDFAPLAEYTIEHRIGDGPPLAPMEMASRIIAHCEMAVVETGTAEVMVVIYWPTMPFLRFHVTGTRYMPSRDPVGIRPEAWAEIEAAYDRFLERMITG